MKKILLMLATALCLMATTQTAQAQIKFGFKAGLNMSDLDYEGWSKDNTTGFFFGPMLDMTIPLLGLGVDGSLLYSKRGNDDYKQSGLEVPINLKYNIGLASFLGVFVAVGPDFFFNFKEPAHSSMDKRACQLGLNLGAGVKVIKHIQVGVNYQWGLTSTYEGSEGNPKTNTWQVSLAYVF